MDPRRPHDSLFRFAFSSPEPARALLRSCLLRDERYRVIAERFDWSRLERIDDAIADAADQPFATDLLFRVPLGDLDLVLHVILEHKSRPDPLVAWQLTRYGVRTIDALHQKLGRGRRLPIVIPLVAYHGNEPWTAPRDLADLFLVPDELPADCRSALIELLPSWTYGLDDLGAGLDERLDDLRVDLVARLALEFLVRMRGLGRDELPAALLRVRDLLVAVQEAPRGQVLLGMLFCYLSATTTADVAAVHAAVRAVLPQRTGDAMLNPLEKAFEDVRNQGLERGLEQGREQGKTELLCRLLSRRFGPLPAEVETRLARATAADIDAWSLRILDAGTLADVFAG